MLYRIFSGLCHGPIRSELFPYESIRRLQAYSVGPFKVFEMGWTEFGYY